jgi:hypothetical protein
MALNVSGSMDGRGVLSLVADCAASAGFAFRAGFFFCAKAAPASNTRTRTAMTDLRMDKALQRRKTKNLTPR